MCIPRRDVSEIQTPFSPRLPGRPLLPAAHRELVLADDYAQAGQADRALRSHLSAASCFWRAGRWDQARELFTALLQEYSTQKPAIQQILAELAHDYPTLGS